jgi:undecaprenyl-diphosphatase
MDILNSVILGIVEGITEFLPISSTAHLILTAEFLKLPQTDYLKSFEIAIQLGAILSVVVLYWKSLLDLEILKRLAVAFMPTGIIGLIMYPVIKQYLFSINIVLWTLLLGGIVMIIFERYYSKQEEIKQDISQISFKQCLAIGLFQSIAIVPGVSRAAATIIGGRILGLSKKTIVEFSFLLAIPTMAGATGIDLIKNYNHFSGDQFIFLTIGFITSFVVAIFSIKLLLGYIRKHDFQAFGVYRITLVILFWIGIK